MPEPRHPAIWRYVAVALWCPYCHKQHGIPPHNVWMPRKLPAGNITCAYCKKEFFVGVIRGFNEDDDGRPRIHA